MKFTFSSMLSAMKPSEIRELLKMANTKGLISFGGGMPDPATFPIEDLESIMAYIFKNSSANAFQYGVTSGIRPLREQIKRLVKETENIDCSEDQINVTSGSQQALYAVSKVLVQPGETVITELPTYVGAISANNANMVNMIGIEMDDNGMRTDLLEDKLVEMKSSGKLPKFIYVIPNFHNPAGYTLSLERRKHLIELAVDYSIPIVEDNPYGELRYYGSKIPSIKSMDPDNYVIYMGTFSKVMTPGLRIGYVLGDAEFISKVNLLKQALDLSTNTLSEYVAYEYLKRDIMKKQIPKNIEIYRKKRDAMLKALSENFPANSKWSRPDGGMFVWATVDPAIDTTKMLARSVRNGVAYISGVSFHPNAERRNNMRINFSYPSVVDIHEGIKRLSRTLEEESAEIASAPAKAS
jgi:2-aminoadipate transaminase